MKKNAFHLFLLFLSSLTIAQPGTLDLSFGTGGKVTTSIGTSHDYLTGMALQQDGKIVVTGQAWNFATADDIGLARYNTDGSADLSFGVGGKVLTTPNGGWTSDESSAVLIQTDGKIIVAGYRNESGSYSGVELLRYNTNGTLDTTFGTAGLSLTHFGAPGFVVVTSAALQADGKIVIGGYYSITSGNRDFFAARLLPNGSIDNAFGTAGCVITPVASFHDQAYSILIQPDGKIILVGYADVGSSANIALVRYDSTGTLDPGFGTAGKANIYLITYSFGYAASLQTDGKILVAGNGLISGQGANFMLVRYNANGTLDNTFGTSGTTITDINMANNYNYSMALQPNGKIITCGYTVINSHADFALIRYDSTGILDPGFGIGGITTTSIGATEDWGTSVLLQPDGKILAGGWMNNGTDVDFALLRYNGSELLSGIDEGVQGAAIKIYPNPTTDMLIIKNGEHSRYTITDLLGKEVVQGFYTSPIDMKGLPKGLYFIKIIAGNQKVYTSSLIKQ